MKWKIKALILSVLALFPRWLSERLHYGLQRHLGALRRLDPWSRLEGAVYALRAMEAHGDSIEGARVLEIGTGWRVNAPVAFYLAGADEVCTVDLNRYLRPELIHQDLRLIIQDESKVRTLYEGLPWDDARWKKLVDLVSRPSLTESGLRRRLGIDYRAPQDATCLSQHESGHFKLQFSQNTFEHIPKATLASILTEGRRVLRTGGWAIHLVDHADHFAPVDASITNANFLRYSGTVWSLLAGHRLSYVNRLRAPEYKKLFEQAGLHVVEHRTRLNERALEALTSGTLQPAQEFLQYAPETAAIDYSWIVSRKSDDT